MESKTKELVKAGHELVVLLGNQHGMIDAASLVQRLTAQLDITAAALREMTKQRDAEHADVLTWEKTMFKVCGEDGTKSVAAKFASLEARLNQMAAENAALREYRPQPIGAAMMEALDAFYEYHEDVPEQGMMAAFEILCCKRPQSLTTAAWQREQMAKGVENAGEYLKQYAQGLHEEARLVLQDAGELCNGYADQLRNGEAV